MPHTSPASMRCSSVGTRQPIEANQLTEPPAPPCSPPLPLMRAHQAAADARSQFILAASDIHYCTIEATLRVDETRISEYDSSAWLLLSFTSNISSFSKLSFYLKSKPSQTPTGMQKKTKKKKCWLGITEGARQLVKVI